jgi:hypothetical protein
MAYEILTSVHGNRLGLDFQGNLVNTDGRGTVNRGIFRGLCETVTVTSAQVLALNATPKTIIAAPGAGKALVFHKAYIHKPAGTAYSDIASGEDLQFKYTNGSGTQVSATVETTGFLDQTTAKTAVVFPQSSTSTTAGSVLLTENAAIVLHLLVGEITTGDSPLYVTVEYEIINHALTAA